MGLAERLGRRRAARLATQLGVEVLRREHGLLVTVGVELGRIEHVAARVRLVVGAQEHVVVLVVGGSGGAATSSRALNARLYNLH